jgi:hypothetical protein
MKRTLKNHEGLTVVGGTLVGPSQFNKERSKMKAKTDGLLLQ